MTVGQGTIDTQSDDVSTTEGGPFNTEWAGSLLHCGFHKSGFARGPALRFPNPGVQAGSIINSATITGDVQTSTGAPDIVAAIRLLLEDGRWNPSSTPNGWQGSTSDDDWRVHLNDGVTQLVTTGDSPLAIGGPNVNGDNLAPQTQRISQGVTITAAGTVTEAEVALGGAFISAGADPCWVEIWSDVSGLPGVLLATSDTRPGSDIVAKLLAQERPLYTFTFPVPEQIAVSINDVYHVVMRNAFTVVNSALHLGTRNYAYAGGDLAAFGNSPNAGFDIQQYLTIDDWFAIATTGGVSWSIPKTFPALATSPSIASLITTRIAQGGYNTSSPFGFRLDITGGSGEVIFRGYPAAGGAAFVLDLDWTPPVGGRRRARLTT